VRPSVVVAPNRDTQAGRDAARGGVALERREGEETGEVVAGDGR
jgi:hypothetical protein